MGSSELAKHLYTSYAYHNTMNNKQIQKTHLESVDEVGALLRGDIVSITDRLVDSEDKTYAAIYYGTSNRGQLKFLVPSVIGGEEYIIMYGTNKNNIEVKVGGIVLNEYKCAIESFNQSHQKYSELNDILQRSSLRQ